MGAKLMPEDAASCFGICGLKFLAQGYGLY